MKLPSPQSNQNPLTKNIITVEQTPDWKDSFKNLFSAAIQLKSKCPFVLLFVFLLPCIRCFMPYEMLSHWQFLTYILDMIYMFAFGIVNYHLVFIYAHLIGSEPYSPKLAEWKTYGKVFLLSCTYRIAYVVGCLLFVVPGLLLGIRASLALPIMCFERRSVIGSLNESIRITRGHAAFIVKQMWAPLLIIVLVEIMPLIPMIMAIIHNPGNFALIRLGVILVAIFTQVTAISSILLTMTQVRLYWYLKPPDPPDPPVTAIEPKPTDS